MDVTFPYFVFDRGIALSVMCLLVWDGRISTWCLIQILRRCHPRYLRILEHKSTGG